MVDGKIDLDDPTNKCTKTPGSQDSEWVMVDLGNIVNVTRVSMVMGPGCCGEF